jgi:hypothetical protein
VAGPSPPGLEHPPQDVNLLEGGGRVRPKKTAVSEKS